MSLNVENIKTQALDADLSSMEQGAMAAGADPEATKEEVTDAVAKVVKDFLDTLPMIVGWFLDDKKAAVLTQTLVNLFGKKLLKLIR